MPLFCQALSPIFPPQLHLIRGAGALKCYRVQYVITLLSLHASPLPTILPINLRVCALYQITAKGSAFLAFWIVFLLLISTWSGVLLCTPQRLTENVLLTQRRSSQAVSDQAVLMSWFRKIGKTWVCDSLLHFCPDYWSVRSRHQIIFHLLYVAVLCLPMIKFSPFILIS